MKIFFILTSLIFIFSCSSVRMIPTSHRTSPKKTSEAKPTTTPMAMPSPEPVPQVATAAPAPTPAPAAPVPVSSRLLPIPKIKPTSDKVFETDPKKLVLFYL